MNKRNTKRGFTITELIIVIVVIAILAAVLIPTFVSLINKANQSADIQAVRQMNTVLKADEAINGKPASVTLMKAVLAAEGIVDLKPMYKNNVFAWHNVDNVVILMDQETQKGVFPKEYKGDDYDAATWEIFGGTVNVAMGELGTNLDEALQNAKPGQTIVLAENQTWTPAAPIDTASIDLNGKKLTLPNGLSMEADANIVISNGSVESGYTPIAAGANVTLDNVDLTATQGIAFGMVSHACELNITGGTIIADEVVGSAYSQNVARVVEVNITDAQLGTQENPCERGVYLITSGDVTISNCTIYATEAALVDRAGNMTVENTTIHYAPESNYVDTLLVEQTPAALYEGKTPGSVISRQWNSSHGAFKAPIVVGDFWAEHYSFDANCKLVNVKVIQDNDAAKTYPDVYLSQENYDVIPWKDVARGPLDYEKVTSENPKRKAQGLEKSVLKTTLTCDNTITWAVNPGKNDLFADQATGEMALYKNYAGFNFSESAFGGVAVLYIDNVFVNGVEQAKGSTSANPIPAN